MNSEKLRRVREAYKERNQLKEKIIEFESARTSPRGTVYGVERVQTSPRGDIQPDAIATLDKLLAEYNAKLIECTELIYEFEKALECLGARERRLFRKYFIDGMTWEQVCVDMNISWTNLHRVRRKALEKLMKHEKS